MYSLDLETSATNPSMKLFAALQPWRLRQGHAKITSVSISDGTDTLRIENTDDNFVDKLRSELGNLSNQIVYCHNAIFDTAWLIAQLQPSRTGRIPDELRNIRWRDTMLLCKWLINGQLAESSRFSYSLANLVKTFLPSHPMTQFFLDMKANKVAPGDNPEYWNMRGDLDALMTLELAKFFQAKLPEAQRTGFLTEQKCIVPVANSWIVGIKVDREQLKYNDRYFQNKKSSIARELGLSEDIFTSTKRLPHLLYNEWNLPVIKKTPTGNPACDADTLKWLEYKLLKDGATELAGKVRLIMDAKSASTSHSKYVKSMIEALEHTGDGYIYPSPKIFGTYTGRFTYSSSTLGRDFDEDTGKKFKCSIAAHQIPRKDKLIRASLVPPDGYVIYEADASGQESRLMALRSADQTMLSVFKNGWNFHSMTGASIIGMDYSDFQAAYKKENDEGYYTEQRQLGKLTNLSCNYRISGVSLSQKAFLDYDVFMTPETGIFLVNTFARRYPGVPNYWENVIWESKKSGYTETFGGRRYKLSEWGSHRWLTESSAINMPIQGAGADMKEIAIAETFEKVPQAIFALDLHDANFFYVPCDMAEELHKVLDSTLNGIDYEKYWGFKLEIDLPYESKRGKSFAEVK